MSDPSQSSKREDSSKSKAKPADERERETGAGRTLGEFRLLRKLGKGGMAEVWLAEQTTLDRKVAIKLLRPDLTEDETYVARFQREASAAGGLNHPNIVQVHMIGEEDGQHYIAQEYVRGRTLKEYLQKKGPPELAIALHIMRQVAAALKAAADAGIVHRDVKPENIMISKKVDVKVADFGLAQLFGPEKGVDITQDGTTMGTPLYMSPEQVNGSKVDPRSDVYSFGVTCYHMLTGRPPYEGPTAMSIAVKHLNHPVPVLASKRPDLPPALSEMIVRMMAKDPDERYQSAEAVLTDVRRLMKAVRQADRPSQIDVGALQTERAKSDADRPLSTRTAVALSVVLFLVTAGTSAGLGWLTRPDDPLAVAAPETPPVEKKRSAREQYAHAMFLGNNEDAWIAVIEFWDPASDRVWIRQAQEWLTLLYLQDKHRWDDAERMLTTLESFRREDNRYHAEAVVGRAALAAYQGNHQRAKSILQSQLGPLRDELPEGSEWRRLVERTQLRITQEEQRLRESVGQPGR